MNRNRTYLSIALVIGLVVSMAPGITGCKTAPDVAAYRTLNTTATTVEAARKAWVDYVGQQRLVLPSGTAARNELEMNVERGAVIYGQYQVAMTAAVKTLETYRALPTDTTPLNAAMTMLSQTAGSWLALVTAIMHPAAVK